MNKAIIKISGTFMDIPYKEVLEFIKEKGLDYEELNGEEDLFLYSKESK